MCQRRKNCRSSQRWIQFDIDSGERLGKLCTGFVRNLVSNARFVPASFCELRDQTTRNSGLNICFYKEIMVLLERIELSTSPLPRECSTSELQQRCGRVIRLKRNGAQGCLDGFFRLL